MDQTVIPEVLGIADLNLDLILRGNVRPEFGQVEKWIDDYDLTLGGSFSIFASQFRKLGGTVGVIGCVGTDRFGDWTVQHLEELGIDTSRIVRLPDEPTGLSVALSEGSDRAILTCGGAFLKAGPEMLPAEGRHWHIASYFLLPGLRDAWPGFAAQFRKAGGSLSLDPNFDPEQKWEGVIDLLEQIDLLFLNEVEARGIASEEDLDQAGATLSRSGTLVVIKCGGEGARAYHQNKTFRHEEPPLPDDEIVDTVGAGDSFDGGFLRGWLLKKSIEECLALGHRCGMESLKEAGGVTGQLQEVVT